MMNLNDSNPVSYKGKQPYIFVSYSHVDKNKVLPIIETMQKDGFRVWYDEGIDPGTEWEDFIASAIDKCGYFFAFISKNYMCSDFCKDEMSYVQNLKPQKKRLLIYLENITLSKGMLLRQGRLQAIHIYTYASQEKMYEQIYSADGLNKCHKLGSIPVINVLEKDTHYRKNPLYNFRAAKSKQKHTDGKGFPKKMVIIAVCVFVAVLFLRPLAGNWIVSAFRDKVDVISSRDWGSIMKIPSEQEITEFNEKSVSLSPYLSGQLDIGQETKFTEYSIDFKADYIPYGTYFRCANMKMDLSCLEQEYDEVYVDRWISFYGGLQMYEPGKGSGSLMSFWDIYCKDKAGEISTIRAKLVYPENREANIFDNNGNGVYYMDNYAWESGHWYRMLFQCGKSEENGHILVEQRVCDLETGNWTKMCCYDTGLTDSCFVGNAVICLEDYLTQYAGDIRTVEYKNIRIRLKDTGQWVPIKQVTMSDNSGFPGSFCFGSDDEQFWMITTGLEKCAIQQCGKTGTFKVISCEDDSPY